MELINGTPETLNAEWDRMPIVFKPFEILTVNDEMAQDLLDHYRTYGLSAIKFGDDEKRIKFECMSRKLHVHRRALMQHDTQNKIQDARKFPPLPDSDAVSLARKAIPLYTAAVDRLRAELGIAVADKITTSIADEIARALEESQSPAMVQPAVTLEDLPLADIRERATEVGLAVDMRWGKQRLIDELKMFETAPRHRVVGEPSGGETPVVDSGHIRRPPPGFPTPQAPTL